MKSMAPFNLLTICSWLMVLGCTLTYATKTEYEVPLAHIERLSPRGFTVSIPDTEGIRLLAFHGNINKQLKGIEAGQFSEDVLDKDTNCLHFEGRNCWTYINRKQRVNKGDTLYYWTYVIKDGLGYLRRNQIFVFNDSTHIRQDPESENEQTPVTIFGEPNHCPPSNEVTQKNCPPTYLGQLTTCLDVLAETREHFNKTKHALALILQNRKQQIESTTPAAPTNQEVPSLYANSLIVGGNLPNIVATKDSYLQFVNFFLWEVLELVDIEAVKAERNSKGYIIFTLRSAADKSTVLLRVKQKFTNSTLFVRDITEKKN